MPKLHKTSQNNHKDLFVYKNDGFETFLKCSNEKKKVGHYLYNCTFRNILNSNYPKIRILDIGSGDSSLMAETLINLPKSNIQYVGLEPVKKNTNKAREILSKIDADWEIINIPFEDYKLKSEKFNMVIASNLYHLDEIEIPAFIKTALSMLVDDGKLYFIYRSGNHDDILELRNNFESLLHEDYKEPRTINTIKDIINNTSIVYKNVDEVFGELDLNNDEATQDRLIEFIFNCSIGSIDEDLLNNIKKSIQDKNQSLRTCQSIMVVEKKDNLIR